MEEDRHLDGRARFAAGCAVLALLLVIVSAELGILFGALGAICAGASVIAVDEGEPASPRTRRLALAAVVASALAVAIGLLLLVTAAQVYE